MVMMNGTRNLTELEMALAEKFRVGIYCRLSKDDDLQGESASIANQRAMLEDYCNKQGWEVVAVFQDDGYTGLNMDRPDFQRMLKAIEKGFINLVITKDLSRLGRNYLETGRLMEDYFPRHGIRYIAMNDGIDTLAENNEIAPFKNILNEMYSKDISKKVHASYYLKATKGEFTGCVAPIGYRKDPENKNHLLIDEETAPIVQKIFQYALEGHGVGYIQRRLEEEEIPCPTWWNRQRGIRNSFTKWEVADPEKGRFMWDQSFLKDLLINPVYIGAMASQKRKYRFKIGTMGDKKPEDWILVENTHDPIISEQDFDAVQSKILARHQQRGDGTFSLFAGLIKCGECGKALTIRKTNAKKPKDIYACVTYNRFGAHHCTQHRVEYDELYAETGEAIIDAEGNAITAETTFKAKKTSGTTEVTFTFDGSALAGKTTVVFEDLYYEDLLLTTHADLEDEEQTIYFPEIGTTATNDKTGDHTALAETEVTLTDTVSYTGLAAGKTYTVTGTLMDRETGKAIQVDGKDVTANAEFTAEAGEGTVDLKFTFDGSALAGKTTVVFESVSYDGVEIAVHAELEDEGQTIYFPEIGTTATNDKTGTHTAQAEKEVTLTDVVAFSNLVEGKTYVVTGTLMDKETGETIEVDGKKIMAETDFTAEASEGTVELHFEFDGSALAGKTIVAFESVAQDGVEVAVHADLADEGQTIHFPEIHTSAADKADGDKEVAYASDVTVVDTVTYTSLTVGETYKVTGTLMDKETGKAIQVDGKDLTAETEFTAESTDGTVEVSFTFNTIDLDGHSVVVFETLTDANGNILASHEDIEDEDQTVTVSKKPETPTETPKEDTPTTPGTTVTTDSPKTGDDSNIMLWGILAAIAACAGIGCGIYSFRKKKDED